MDDDAEDQVYSINRFSEFKSFAGSSSGEESSSSSRDEFYSKKKFLELRSYSETLI